jgi:prolyl-tRNA editing enzyme YbaK/EbsC (Cys-tRNA(Pro) deacylase)
VKTSVTEFLDAAGVQYEVKPHRAPVYTCEEAARERGVRLSQIVKCMIGRDPKGQLHVMLLPGDKTLKLKRVRQTAGGARVELISPDRLAEEFGVVVGAISPFQFVGRARIYMDNSIFEEALVDISSGSPDAGVDLAAERLLRRTVALRCDIISTSYP